MINYMLIINFVNNNMVKRSFQLKNVIIFFDNYDTVDFTILDDMNLVGGICSFSYSLAIVFLLARQEYIKPYFS